MTGNERSRGDGLFLPDFCALAMVFAVVVLAELFAVVLVLFRDFGSTDFWAALALTSLFVQWNALTGAGVLCAGRPLWRRMGNAGAAVVAYLMLLAVMAVISEGAFRIVAFEGRFGGLSHDEFILRNLAVGAVVAALVLRYLYVQHQWRRRVRAESEARLQALQARIRPHFLFNSMNTVANLTRTNPAVAERVVEDLADLFRAALSEHRALVPLEDELALCRRYLGIEQERLGGRLQVAWDLDEVPATALIPPLTLQPLVENAVYHGIEGHPDGGTVTVSARCRGDSLTLEVSNPLPPGHHSHRAGNRLALTNIRERLQGRFGDSAELSCSEEGGQHRARIRVPLRTESP